MYRSLTSAALVMLFAVVGCQGGKSNSDERCDAGGTVMDTFIQKGFHAIDPSCTIDCIVVSDGYAFPGAREYPNILQLYIVRRTYWKSIDNSEHVRAQKDYKALGFVQMKKGDAVDLVPLLSYEDATRHGCTAFLIFPKK